jgi:hypothetical protein
MSLLLGRERVGYGEKKVGRVPEAVFLSELRGVSIAGSQA